MKTYQERNEAFNAATAAGKRVLIAQDVINQVKAGRYKAKSRVWVNMTEDWLKQDKDAQVCELSDKLSCEVCGIGSLMLSEIRFNDRFKVSDMYVSKGSWNKEGFYDYNKKTMSFDYDDHQDCNRINNFFTKDQIKLIELAFELGDGQYSIFTSLDYEKEACKDKAIEFGKKYKSVRTRLIKIMKNIIENEGTFKP